MGSDSSAANDRDRLEQNRRLLDWWLNEGIDIYQPEEYSHPENENGLRPGFVEEMIQYILDHPIDPAYDEICGPDAHYDEDEFDPVVCEQLLARDAYEALKREGALPDELRRPDDPPEQTGK